ncbi:MAG: tRNA (N6-threonylcarbamoyladenosine(37)-N6)-methyltransferase TrmO [Bacteroidales bacterium]|nr:tRNA (N6-threonylcarbamoyladenosine(37)-N6)-methyltransferase TrmO [Bacteroidales bacterium]
MQENKKKLQITYTPIGIIHTDYSPENRAPRQGIFVPEGKGRIDIYPQYQEALQSLELFEYIIVIYHLDKVRGWKHTVKPPESNPDYTFGLFATRTPNRPNPVGIAVIKLEKIENGKLYVSGVDAFDGTPVLDLKPYITQVDSVKTSRNEFVQRELGLGNYIYIDD